MRFVARHEQHSISTTMGHRSRARSLSLSLPLCSYTHRAGMFDTWSHGPPLEEACEESTLTHPMQLLIRTHRQAPQPTLELPATASPCARAVESAPTSAVGWPVRGSSNLVASLLPEKLVQKSMNFEPFVLLRGNFPLIQ